MALNYADAPIELNSTFNFFQQLYGDSSPGYQVIVSINKKTGAIRSYSFPASGGLYDAALKVQDLSENMDLNIYFSVGLQAEAKSSKERGDSNGVLGLPGLWFDLDRKGPGHTEENLPETLDDALDFLESAIPIKPSFVVNSGGGLYPFWLFDNPWILESDENRKAAAELSRLFQQSIKNKAKILHGWNLDITSDLARILRPPGSRNNKLSKPREVFILEDSGKRYSPEEFKAYLNDAGTEYLDLADFDEGNFPPAKIGEILKGCAFMDYCRTNPAMLTEPQWYAMLSILVRCEDSANLAHEWSKDYPRYSFKETAKKLQRAGTAAGPSTCRHIKENLGGDFCDSCKSNVKSPAVLGIPRKTAIIINNRFLPDLTGEILLALEKANNPPRLFSRLGGIVRIEQITERIGSENIVRPVIKPLNEAMLRGEIARAADFKKARKTGLDLELLPAFPPLEAVRDVLSLGAVNFPVLSMVLQIPILRPDGSLHSEPGYDITTGLYYSPEPGFSLPSIPDKPARKTINKAVDVLWDVFSDFPFDSSASRANIMAAVLTVVLRDLINGPIPLLVIDKPSQGTGASLLSDVISTIGTGKPAFMTSRPEGRGSEEEMRKKITAILIDGRPLVVLDNVEGVFRSAVLCSALTANLWSDRILGRSENVDLPHRTVWIATGNNIRLAGDLPRRSYAVRLDAKQARPWQRGPETFRYPHLLRHVREQRPRILSAIFVMARAWINAGKPEPAKAPVLGSFDEWRRVIGGILDFAGINGFLENLEDVYAASLMDDGLEGFIEVCQEIFGEKPFKARDIFRELTEQKNETLENALPPALSVDDRGFTRKLGNLLSVHQGKVFANGIMLLRGKDFRRAATWLLKSV